MTIPSLPWPIWHYTHLDSTQLEAQRLVAQEIPKPAIVWADSQHQGQGRLGRSWISPPGHLYVSFLLSVQAWLQPFSHISYVSGLAVREMLQTYLTTPVPQLKWPNDILVEGKKISGILCEYLPSYTTMIVGIGVNIGPLCLGSYPSHATTLAHYQAPPPLFQVLATLVSCLERWIALWRSEGFSFIRSHWIENTYHKTHPEIHFCMGNKTIQGDFYTLDAMGQLVLKLQDHSLMSVHSGEITPVAGV